MQLAKRFLSKASSETPTFLHSRHLYRAACLVLFFLGLLGGIYLAFPDAVFQQRLVKELEARLPVRIELAEAGLRPLLTLTADKAVIDSLYRPGIHVTIDRFYFSPYLRSLFTSDPAGRGEIFTAGGKVAFRCKRSGPLALEATDLRLNIPLATVPAMRVGATLATGKMISALPLRKNTQSLVDITLDQVVVQGLEALTNTTTGLHLGTLSLRMTGQGTAFSIERLEASEGDLLVSGKGTLLLLLANPRASRINLSLSVRAGSKANPSLTSLLELAGTKQPDGSRKLSLTGTFVNPMIK